MRRGCCQALKHAHIAVAAEPWIRERLDGEALASLSELTPEQCEAVLSVGGDGTLLRANALAVRCNLPLLGVNVGRVGFLTEVELDRLEEACARLANEEYTLETRMMLKASMGDRTDYALNDVVLSRGGYSRLIGVNAWVDGDRVGPFIADGLIVSTPTGSTATPCRQADRWSVRRWSAWCSRPSAPTRCSTGPWSPRLPRPSRCGWMGDTAPWCP